MGQDIRWERFQSEWAPIRARLAALDLSLWQRATDLAGLGAGRNVWFNAMIGLADGHPWREVNYTRLRRALRIDGPIRDRVRDLDRSMFRALYARHYPEREPIGTHAIAA